MFIHVLFDDVAEVIIFVPLFVPHWEIYIHIFSAASQWNPQTIRMFCIKKHNINNN